MVERVGLTREQAALFHCMRGIIMILAHRLAARDPGGRGFIRSQIIGNVIPNGRKEIAEDAPIWAEFEDLARQIGNQL